MKLRQPLCCTLVPVASAGGTKGNANFLSNGTRASTSASCSFLVSVPHRSKLSFSTTIFRCRDSSVSGVVSSVAVLRMAGADVVRKLLVWRWRTRRRCVCCWTRTGMERATRLHQSRGPVNNTRAICRGCRLTTMHQPEAATAATERGFGGRGSQESRVSHNITIPILARPGHRGRNELATACDSSRCADAQQFRGA